MKLHTVTLALVSVMGVAAQGGINDLPDCAKNCATNSLPKNCNALDPHCICSSESFILGISCCVARACPPSAQQQALDFARKICDSAGVTNLPSSAHCPMITDAVGSQTAPANATSTSAVLSDVTSSIAASTSVKADTSMTTTAASTSAAATSTEAASSVATGAVSNGSTLATAATTDAASGSVSTNVPAPSKTANAGVTIIQYKEIVLTAAGAAAFAILA